MAVTGLTLSVSPGTSGVAPFTPSFVLSWIGGVAPFSIIWKTGVTGVSFGKSTSQHTISFGGYAYQNPGTYTARFEILEAGATIPATTYKILTVTAPTTPPPTTTTLKSLLRSLNSSTGVTPFQLIIKVEVSGGTPNYILKFYSGETGYVPWTKTGPAGVYDFSTVYRTAGTFTMSVLITDAAGNHTQVGHVITVTQGTTTTPPPPTDGLDTINLDDFLKAPSGSTITTIQMTPAGVLDAIQSTFKFMSRNAVRTIEAMVTAPGPVNIDNALESALTTAGVSMVAGFSIYALATATDLLHPLKGTGFVPVAIDIVNKLGSKMVSDTLVGSYAKAAIAMPLELYYNRILRPFRPYGALVDQMFFEGHIDEAGWRQAYRFQGWPENLITAQLATIFVEPSDRLLIAMFEDEKVPRSWIRQKLKERGYNETDVDVIAGYGIRRGLERRRENTRGLLLQRYKEGFTTLAELLAEAQAFGYDVEDVTEIGAIGEKLRNTEERKERSDVQVALFRKGLISSADLQASLSKIYHDPDKVAHIVLLENLRKKGTPGPVEPKAPELRTSSIGLAVVQKNTSLSYEIGLVEVETYSPLVGKTVFLERYDVLIGTYKPLDQGTTGTTGKFATSIYVEPRPGEYKYRASWDGDNDYKPDSSPVMTIKIT